MHDGSFPFVIFFFITRVCGRCKLASCYERGGGWGVETRSFVLRIYYSNYVPSIPFRVIVDPS